MSWGTRKGNELGIYDMSGNVWEWCFDQWVSTGTTRVIRGGSWIDFAYYARVSYRFSTDPSISYDDIGFRVVRSSVP
jgi:sulfatase modifying factor 1